MKQLLILLFSVLALRLSAQDIVISDSGRIAPFKGSITYSLSYPGQKDSVFLNLLPDTLVCYVQFPYIKTVTTVHSLGRSEEVWWNAQNGEFLLIDHHEKKIYDLPEYYSAKKNKTVKGTKTKIVLGHPCRQFDLTREGYSDSFWVNDSIVFTGPVTDSLVKFWPPFLLQGSRSLPLRMLRKTPAGSTLTEAVHIRPDDLPQGVFVLPEGYTRLPFDPLRHRHPVTESLGK